MPLEQHAERIWIAGHVPAQQFSVRETVVLPNRRLQARPPLFGQRVALGLLIVRIRRCLPPDDGPRSASQRASKRCPVLITSS